MDKGVKDKKHRVRVSCVNIAEITGMPVSTVRRHKREGKLNPKKLESVAKYIVREYLKEAR